MKEIKFITDSASDIPDTDLERLEIEMLHIPIAVDGKGYYERKDFDFQGFYDLINKSKEIPATSLIPEITYTESYEKNYTEGYKNLIVVTINKEASGIFNSATRAKETFFKKHPEAEGKIGIHIVDSGTYSAGYGHAIIKGAEMAEAGESVEAILAFLDDWFNRLEIYAGCYTLKYAGKSGRINFATAFVGEVLGMRPIISLIAGKTETEQKIRGDKNIPPALIEQYKKAGIPPDEPLLIIHGEDPEPAKVLSKLFKTQFGFTPPIYNAGAAIVTNIGPKVLAIVYKGEHRGNC